MCELIRRHAIRVCPWATLWCAPDVEGIRTPYAGTAWRGPGVAVIRTDGSAPDTLSLAWHELWHLLETWLPQDILDALDGALATGPAYSRHPGTREEYLSLPHERRARAFAHLGMLAVEGVSLPSPGFFRDDPWTILRRAWDGDLGAEAAERREATMNSERHRIAHRTFRTTLAA